WQTANVLLDKIVSVGRSMSNPRALSKVYEGSVKEPDMTQSDAYRAALKNLLVENGLSVNARRTILESLLREEWTGQEEWFVSLFGDPNLSRQSQSRTIVTTGGATVIGGLRVSGNSRMRDFWRRFNRADPIPLSIALSLNPRKWIPVIAGLTTHEQAAVRNAAISSLVTFVNNDEAEKKAREEAARTLLPWLTKPDWASVQGRAEFIFSLTEIDAPESIPGLLWVLDNDDDDYIRDAVVEALAQHCDSRLAPALKGILPTESNEDVRWQIVTALAKCGGFSDEE